MRGKLKIRGGKSLEKELKKLPAKIMKKVVAKAIRTAAKPLLAQVKAGTPVDTGALKKSEKIITIKKRGKNKFKVGFLIGANDKGGFANTNTWYGLGIEFGNKKVPPVGMIRKAYDSGGEGAMNNAMEEIKQGIKHI